MFSKLHFFTFIQLSDLMIRAVVHDQERGQIWVCQGFISSTFYKQLLHLKIPKVQKDTDDLTVFCAFGIYVCKHFV